MSVKFSNNATTELASSIGTSDTSITVVDASKFPILTAGDYTYVTLDTDTASPTREIVRVTAIAGNVLTVTRGQDGTSPASFAAGTKVELRLTAALLNDVAGANPSGEPIGFPDKSQTTITFDSGIRTFSITPTGASFDVYCKGVKYTYTTVQLVTIPNTTGLHFIYFNASGVLSTQMSYFTWEEHAPTAYVYWNATTQQAIYFGDERHGITLDWQTHEYLHRTRGAAIANGFAASGYTTTGLGATDADAQIDIGGGTFFDEDMQVDIVSTNTPVAGTWQQDLSGPARIPVLYLSGSAWVIDAPTNFPFKAISGVPQYNLYSSGTWSTAGVTNNSYFVSWILATNNLTYPVISVISQAPTNQLSVAEAMTFEGLNLNGFPSVEFRPLYKVIYQYKEGFSNSVKSSTIAVYDLRSISSAGVAAALVQDHGNLSGLTDDDHPQYVHTSEVRTPSAAVKNSFFPSQVGQTGKYLSTDGTNTVWEPAPSGSLSFTGDVTGTGSTGSSVSLTLAASGVVAGQYTKVTVDAKGRVTAGTSVTSSDVTTALGYTPYNATNPAGYTTNVGTVTSVSGTGTVSGLTLTGSVTSSGSLTLGGTLSLTSGQVTTALGFTPYNATNPSGYITSSSNITGTAAGITGYTLADVTGTPTTVMTRNSGGDSAVGSRFHFTTCTADGGNFALVGLNWGGAAGTYKDFEVYDYPNSRPLFRAFGSTRNFEVYGTLTAPNFADSTGTYNVNLGSGGSEGRGLVAGYSGGSYGGIGYNVRHTTTGDSYIAPGGDTSSYLRFAGGGFSFLGAAAGSVGRSLSYTTLASISAAGTFNAVNLTNNGNQVLHAGNYGSGYFKTINGSSIIGTGDLTVSGTDNTKLPLSGGTLTGTIYVGTSGSTSATRALRVGPSGGSPASFGSYTGSWRSTIEIWDNAATRMLHLTPPDGTNYNYSSIKSTDAGLRIDVGGSGGTNAIDIGTNGVANFPQGLQQGGNQVLHAGNYNDYAPSKTGTGASGTWSIAIGVPDTRGVVQGPQTGGSKVRFDFVQNSTDALSDGGTYHGVMTFQQWGDSSGGGTRQLGFTDNDNLWIRGSGSGLSSYNAWKLLLNSSNYSSYALPLTGGTITGSRPIQISPSDGALFITAANGGGWSMGTYFKGSSGTIRAGFGALGSNNDLSYAWIGTGYDGAWMTLTPSSIAVNTDFQLGSNYLRFDQSGVRSWNMRATGGNLDLNSGDGNGSFRYNGNSIFTAAGGVLSGAIRAPQITAGGSNNTDANFGVQGTSHLTGTVYWGGTVGNVNSWSSLQSSSGGNHTLSVNTFVVNRSGYGGISGTYAGEILRVNEYGYAIAGGRFLADSWVQSDRDFPNGTLITTDINYNVTSGDPFVLEIRGNSYGNIVPLDIQYQGYIYSDTIINHGGISNGLYISGLVAINNGGNLCFWFPSQGYWNGYYVRVYVPYATYPRNRVTSITHVAKPTTAKQVDLSANIRQSLHSSNYTSYAVALSGDQSISGTKTFTTQIRTNRIEGTDGAFLFRIGIQSGTTRHINLADTNDDPSAIGSPVGITWGARTDANPYYIIYPYYYGNGYSTHTRLRLAWHTGIEIGAASGYGGTRFYNNSPFTGAEIFSVGKGDDHVRVNNNLYVGGNLALHAGNYSSYALPLSGGTVSGSIVASGNITAYSDERLKKDWAVLPENFVERLAGIKSGTFTRIDSGARQAGSSAQDWQKLLPEVVSEESDGTLALAYGNAALVSAVELAKELVMLKKELAEIKSRLH